MFLSMDLFLLQYEKPMTPSPRIPFICTSFWKKTFNVSNVELCLTFISYIPCPATRSIMQSLPETQQHRITVKKNQSSLFSYFAKSRTCPCQQLQNNFPIKSGMLCIIWALISPGKQASSSSIVIIRGKVLLHVQSKMVF